MSEILPTSAALGLLEQLRTIIRDFIAREEKFRRESRAAEDSARTRFAVELAKDKEAAEREAAEAAARFEQAKEQVHGKFAARERRLADAHGSTRKRGLEYVQQTEDRRKYAVQKGTLDTERSRDEALAKNDAAFADFQGQLAESRAALAEIERQAFSAFRGYRGFRKPLLREYSVSGEENALDHVQIIERLRSMQTETTALLEQFRKQPLPKLFRVAPLWCWFVLALVCAFGLRPGLAALNFGALSSQQFYGAAGIGFGLILAVFALGSRSRPLALKLGETLSRARSLYNLGLQKVQSWHTGEIERIKRESRERAAALQQEWKRAVAEAAQLRESWPINIEEKWRRIQARNDQLLRARSARLEAEQNVASERLKNEAAARAAHITRTNEAKLSELQHKHAHEWERLVSEWRGAIEPLFERLSSASAAAEEQFPRWNDAIWKNWNPPSEFSNAARFANLEVDISKYAGAAPQDAQLALPQPALTVPLLLTYPREGSLFFESSGQGKAPVIAALNDTIYRLLASAPPGKLSFTIFDPVGLGENFAGLNRLADFEANLLNGRIWTQQDQLEERLADLNQHMEKVIQMYLRNEYETIAEYNRAAGNIAEKYHFVVFADFPVNLSETASRRLLRIASTGARCGVYTLIHWDPRHGAPADALLDELKRSSIYIKHAGNSFVLVHPSATPARVLLESPPPPDVGNAFLSKIGERSGAANRVEVPFAQVTPGKGELWSANSAEEVRIPIGRSGPNKLQYLALGRGTRQHALLAGKTGSGKSTLFHVIITNGALWFSPEQIEFYLIDFKKGVEFKAYATRHLPHARVVAIESDREFAVSVLQRVDEELRRRGELFRAAGVQDLAGYRRAAPGENMPRSLLIIDEFQEFFVEEDRLAQSAAMLLDRIVRQGRAFGIHVLLGSQTLGGVYTLARSTIGQMVIRIALQSNEADAYLIMDENNAAPRLLSRPGEGIYNDMAGAVEGNSPFQAVWISENERDEALRRIRREADRSGRPYGGPIAFEGNAPADLRDNAALMSLVRQPLATPAEAARVWLGAPNSIKEPTQATFRRRSGSNLLIVGQREEAVLGMTVISLLALGSQFPKGAARFYLLESATPGSSERHLVDKTVAAVPLYVTLANADLNGAIHSIAQELSRRTEQNLISEPRIFLIVHGLHNFKKLRPEDEFSYSMEAGAAPSPAAEFTKIYTEGPSHGIHVIASVDTYNNVNRFLGRKGLSEFEMRVLFQMSANDSASLCDDPRASQLGLYRALFYNEQEGSLETFRPYALPAASTIEELGGEEAIGAAH